MALAVYLAVLRTVTQAVQREAQHPLLLVGIGGWHHGDAEEAFDEARNHGESGTVFIFPDGTEVHISVLMSLRDENRGCDALGLDLDEVDFDPDRTTASTVDYELELRGGAWCVYDD